MPTGTSALPGSSSVFRQLHGVKNRRRPRSGGFQPPTDAPTCIFLVRAQPRRFRITFEFMPTGRSALPGSSSVFRQLHGVKNRRRPRSGGFQPPTDAMIFIFHLRAQPRRRRIRFEFMPKGTSALPGSSSVFRQLHGVKNRRRPRSGGFQPLTDAPICIFLVRAQPRRHRITFEFMPTGTSALPDSSSVFRQLHGVKNRRRPRSGGFQPPTDAPTCIFLVRAQPRRFRIRFEFMPTGTSALPGSSSVFRQLLGIRRITASKNLGAYWRAAKRDLSR